MIRLTRRALSTLTALVMVGTLFIGAPAPVRAATFYWVSQSGSVGAGTGCTDADFVGFDETPIAAAVAAASDGDTIRICSGTYAIANTIDLAGETIILDPADPDAAPTILDGGRTTQILKSSGAITVSNLTFMDGYTEDDGGAIYSDTTITVTNSRFIRNDADVDGGAIYATTAATVTNSRFISNDAGEDGGAVYAPTVTVTTSTFAGNTAVIGGAIYAASTVTVTTSTFAGNTADFIGGAIYTASTATVTGSTFVGNTAADFGGGAIAAPTATVSTSTFTNNDASDIGGAILATTATVTTSTFTDNTADYGGAIAAFDFNSGGGTATVTTSTFTSNSAAFDGGAILASTGTIARSRFIRNTAGGHGGAVHLWSPNSDNLQQLRRNTFTRNRADAGGAIVLGSCGPVDPGAAKAARVERANSFSGNRATEQRRTNNIETGYCGD